MDISVFLAQAMGLFYGIVGLAVLMRKKEFMTVFADLVKNGPLMLMMKLYGLLIGILLILSHNIWEADWRIVVTLLSWGIFVKYVLWLFWHDRMAAFSKKLMDRKQWMIWGLIILLLAAYLLYYGFLV